MLWKMRIMQYAFKWKKVESSKKTHLKKKQIQKLKFMP